MTKLSLTKKIFIFALSISLVFPIVAGIIIKKNYNAAKSYRELSEVSFPKTLLMKEVLLKFREIRIQVRSIPLEGNSPEDKAQFLQATLDALKDFLVSKDLLVTKMNASEEEIRLIKLAEEKWNTFYNFGGELIALIKKGDPESMKKVADLVRIQCPIYATAFDKSVRDMISSQQRLAAQMTQSANEAANQTFVISIVMTLLSLIFAIAMSIIFAKKLSNSIHRNILSLSESAQQISDKASEMASVSKNLSKSAEQQAASLQDTASAVDEISSMVAQNKDNTIASAQSAEKSLQAVQSGKHKVQSMITSIDEIAKGNDFLIEQMNRSNKEILEITNLIQNISKKTQVINDIVFQTKMLSFNASVEAARAGEHGKGFAIVAEEVGNLAAMSGKASEEISKMLQESVSRVTDIVNATNTLLVDLIENSKKRISNGTSVARECAQSLDEILKNVTTVNNSIKSISQASSEQAKGVSEVNKAMNEVDGITRGNTETATQSSVAASELNVQVQLLNKIVSELSSIVTGERDPIEQQAQVISFPDTRVRRSG